MSAADVELAGLKRAYGRTLAVDNVNIAVAPGELLALLGPSGCGKTTTLRMIAGFVTPTAGTITIAGRDVTDLPPHRRDTGMVFQSYALFPHLSVAENIAFGLKRRGVAKAEIEKRVAEAIDMLRLDGLAARLPAQLSGGQQQRVAVGRALVINPSVLLLDEPFSNLDAQLRESTREELRRLQRRIGITAIFVTHDQGEALAMADRVAVMKAGRIEQLGEPTEIYKRPASRFVASFIGRSNIFSGRARPTAAGATIALEDGLTLATADRAGEGEVVALVRPEAIALKAEAATGENSWRGPVEAITFHGASSLIDVAVGGRRLLVEAPVAAAAALRIGESVTASWRAEDVIICEGVPR